LWRRGVGVIESHTLLRECIQVWRDPKLPAILIPITSDVRNAVVIGEYEQNIWLACLATQTSRSQNNDGRGEEHSLKHQTSNTFGLPLDAQAVRDFLDHPSIVCDENESGVCLKQSPVHGRVTVSSLPNQLRHHSKVATRTGRFQTSFFSATMDLDQYISKSIAERRSPI
jgi:hypothetical protein